MNPLHWLARPELAALAAALVHFLWQGTLIALLLAAVVRLLRIERTTHRYACSLAALLAMALCPVITFWATTRVLEPAPATAANEYQGTAENAVSDSRQQSSVAAASLPSLQAAASAAQPYLLAIWLTGVSALGLRLIAGVVGVVRLSRQRLPLPQELVDRVVRLGKKLGIDALRRVYLSRAVHEALVVGIWRPIVLVPAAWVTEMPLSALEAIVAHELAHIRRFDLWVNLLQRVVETLLFYHPAVWWVSRRLSQEREMCCDELAVEATGRKLVYVETLELVARERQAGVRPALTAGIRGETNMRLLARVRNVLGSPAGDTWSLWPAGLLALLLPLGLWGVTCGIFSPSPAAAVAADDDRDDDDRDDDDDDRDDDEGRDDDDDDEGRDDGDDDDDEKESRDKEGDRKEGDRERDDEGEVKKAALRKFLEARKDVDRDDDEGEARKERKEGDDPAPKKDRPDGDAPKKERADGDAPKKGPRDGEEVKKGPRDGEELKKGPRDGEAPKPRKEGDQPRKIVKEREGERKDVIKKPGVEREGDAPEKKKIAAEGKQPAGDGGELAAIVKELRGEVERLRAEVHELRAAAGRGEEGASGKIKDIERLKKDASEARDRDDKEAVVKEKLLDALRAKEQAAKREAAERNEREDKERVAVEQKLAEAARDKARAAEREAAERKEREIKERDAAEQKEREANRK